MLYKKSVKTLLSFFLLFAGVSAFSAEPDLSFLDYKRNTADKTMFAFESYPTARCWQYKSWNDVSILTSRRSVGPDSSVLLFTEKGEKPGDMLFMDTGCQKEDPKTYKGFSFWMRGDGGDGVLSLGTNWNQNSPDNPRIGTFPLAQKEWKKIFVPWSKFTKLKESNTFWFWNAKVAPLKPRAAWAQIARPSLYAEEIIEPIQPVETADPEGMLPAGQFVKPGVAEALKLMPKILAKLKAGLPVTIVVAGDSITAGAQLWYTERPGKGFERDSESYIYHAVLEQKLAAFYKYKNNRFILKKWESVDKKTGKTPSGNTADGFAITTPGITPIEDGTLPFDGLQVIGVGAGGKTTQFGAEHLDDLTQFKPDLVIWMYGINDALGKNIKAYVTHSTTAIKALQEKKYEVLLSGTTFFLGNQYFENSASFREPGMEMAKTLNVPFVDNFGAFTARGQRYIGDLLSDNVHPNHIGHRFMASVLAASLGLPEQFVWDQPFLKLNYSGKK